MCTTTMAANAVDMPAATMSRRRVANVQRRADENGEADHRPQRVSIQRKDRRSWYFDTVTAKAGISAVAPMATHSCVGITGASGR